MCHVNTTSTRRQHDVNTTSTQCQRFQVKLRIHHRCRVCWGPTSKLCWTHSFQTLCNSVSLPRLRSCPSSHRFMHKVLFFVIKCSLVALASTKTSKSLSLDATHPTLWKSTPKLKAHSICYSRDWLVEQLQMGVFPIWRTSTCLFCLV